MKFELLVNTIEQTHQHFLKQASKAVNVSLTLRNWFIGFYIVEFEQKGEDRAKYGEKLFKNLADKIAVKGLGETNLKTSRLFYTIYPELKEILFAKTHELLPFSIRQFLTDELTYQNMNIEIKTPSMPLKGDRSIQYLLQMVQRISFTHFVELLKIEDSTKRAFFELLILKTTPKVKELKRQINTLAYERVGLSNSTENAYQILTKKIEPELPIDAIKSIYSLDFLGLKSDSLIEEKELETALLNHLQDFMLELGNGFCFESRQKRLLIDDEYYFADLVFYHRILKCHILIELKIDAFKQEYLSQLNTYVSFYREEVKRADDNPPIGILLCTEKGIKLVEYALSGMDEQLFVSKYLLELPKKEQLEIFITNELQKWNS